MKLWLNISAESRFDHFVDENRKKMMIVPLITLIQAIYR